MTSFDIIIIVVFVCSVAVGYRKGLLKQLGSFCAFFAAVAASRVLTAPVSQWIDDKGYIQATQGAMAFLSTDYMRGILVAVVIFAITFIVVRIIVSYLQVAIETLHLSIVNKIGGVIFTTFVSFLVLSIILNVFQLFKTDSPIVDPSGLCQGKLAVGVMELAPATLGVATTWFENVKRDEVDSTTNNDN